MVLWYPCRAIHTLSFFYHLLSFLRLMQLLSTSRMGLCRNNLKDVKFNHYSSKFPGMMIQLYLLWQRANLTWEKEQGISLTWWAIQTFACILVSFVCRMKLNFIFCKISYSYPGCRALDKLATLLVQEASTCNWRTPGGFRSWSWLRPACLRVTLLIATANKLGTYICTYNFEFKEWSAQIETKQSGPKFLFIKPETIESK